MYDKNQIVWSLKNINCEIEQGEAIGIIGRNGAGKSTLLKILSRITSPTKGVIRARGRIASLLEVGTGFHPELTGKENIYLNGAILGMRRNEISQKLNEIIEFSGVEKYIDTPVKRYSSGMYVRLAFAVAAHLDSDILVVDEVLAVGDAEFQKKCLGKIGDVTKDEGRTVLFVSHNMSAIQNLCSKCLLLNYGEMLKFGQTQETLNHYVELAMSVDLENHVYDNKYRLIRNVILKNKDLEEIKEIFMNDDLLIQFEISFREKISNAEIGINVKNIYDEIFTHVTTLDKGISIDGEETQTKTVTVKLTNLNFTPGLYKIDIALVNGTDRYEFLENVTSFHIIQGSTIKRPNLFPAHVKTYVYSDWDVTT